MNPLLTNISSIKAAESALLVIDIQEKLAPAMDESCSGHFHEKSLQLVKAASLMKMECAYTEQNPEKLGPTLPEYLEFLKNSPLFPKMHFNAVLDRDFSLCLLKWRDRNVRSVIVTGIEAHVCVLMTAVSLREKGFAVFVPYDAVCSRRSENAEKALEYMIGCGIQVLPVETLLFSLVSSAGTDLFRSILKIVK